MEEQRKKGGAEAEGPAPAASGAAPACGAFAGVEMEFPVTFDLKIIYVLAEGGKIVEDLERIYAALGVKCAMIQGVAAPGAKYGRMGSRLTFETREQMYAAYAAIGKLPYVKTAI